MDWRELDKFKSITNLNPYFFSNFVKSTCHRNNRRRRSTCTCVAASRHLREWFGGAHVVVEKRWFWCRRMTSPHVWIIGCTISSFWVLKHRQGSNVFFLACLGNKMMVGRWENSVILHCVQCSRRVAAEFFHSWVSVQSGGGPTPTVRPSLS
jgi:hypothetical protein